MRDKAQDAIQMAKKRNDFLTNGFALFSGKTINAVSMQDIADASGYGVATLYRYFNTKQVFVVAVATQQWKEFLKENHKRLPSANYENMTAMQCLDFYFDSFLELYRNHKDLLRFHQYFNVYVQAEGTTKEMLEPYRQLIQELEDQFRVIYEKAEHDHTVNTETPEKVMFSSIMHLMMAAITRYAVGLVYQPENVFDAEKELTLLADMLKDRYRS